MYDKKRSANQSAFTSVKKNESDRLDRHLVEQNIINTLISINQQKLSLTLLCKQSLSLLFLHPFFTCSAAVIWRIKDKEHQIMAKHSLDSELEKALNLVSIPEPSEEISAKIQWSHSNTDNEADSQNCIDICLGSDEKNYIAICIWVDFSRQTLTSVYSFLENFFGVFHLLIEKIESQKKENIYKKILENTITSVEITDHNTVIQYVNPSFERITQYTSAEALYKPASSLIRAEDASPVFFNDIKSQLDAGKIWKGEIRSRRKDGSLWIAQAIIIPFFDEEEGLVTHHIAIKEDITEQVDKLHLLNAGMEKYQRFMEASSDAIFINDINGVIVDVNDAACLSLGYTHEEIKRYKIWEIEVGISHEQMSNTWDNLPEDPFTVEGTLRRKDGTTFPVETRIGVYNTGYQKFIIAICRDITDRKKIENKVTQLAQAIEQSPVLMMITNKSGIIEYASNKLTELTGYTVNEIIGKSSSIFKSETMNKHVFEELWSTLLSGSKWRGEILNKNKQGELFWVSSIISPLINKSGSISHYLAIMEDITQQKIHDEILKRQATYDKMTNLPNRLYGQTKLEKSIELARNSNAKIALLYIDLDGFKHINDSLGHAVGDMLLQKLASRLLSLVRHNDTIARVGGDEFMIILDDIQYKKDAENIAAKCLKACQTPFIIQSQEISISASIGIALFPEHGNDSQLLMHYADTAMYHAKDSGKNKWKIYNNSMPDKLINNTLIKAELKKSIINKEFNLHYQPLIDIKSNKLLGAEALLRWENEKIGNIYPSQIIPLAEQTGDIHLLGEWIMHTACKQMKQWQKLSAQPLKIAVNVSILQLKNPQFIGLVKSALDQSELSPEHLILEVTESALIDSSSLLFEQLKKLSEMKIECSLDDFCMNYSSLDYLKSYLFDSLKIDKSYIQDIHNNKNNLSLIQNIITLSRQLKLKVIAEGVETSEQLHLLRSLNCDYAQGWYFSKPLSEDRFLEWMLGFA